MWVKTCADVQMKLFQLLELWFSFFSTKDLTNGDINVAEEHQKCVLRPTGSVVYPTGFPFKGDIP